MINPAQSHCFESRMRTLNREWRTSKTRKLPNTTLTGSTNESNQRALLPETRQPYGAARVLLNPFRDVHRTAQGPAVFFHHRIPPTGLSLSRHPEKVPRPD